MISPKKKQLLCSFQDMICEQCKKVFKLENLEIHRINRAYQGGTYKDHRNLKVLCVKCHQLYHGNENRNVQGK